MEAEGAAADAADGEPAEPDVPDVGGVPVSLYKQSTEQHTREVRSWILRGKMHADVTMFASFYHHAASMIEAELHRYSSEWHRQQQEELLRAGADSSVLRRAHDCSLEHDVLDKMSYLFFNDGAWPALGDDVDETMQLDAYLLASRCGAVCCYALCVVKQRWWPFRFFDWRNPAFIEALKTMPTCALDKYGEIFDNSMAFLELGRRSLICYFVMATRLNGVTA